ncbi:MAG: ferritin family protein [Chloroflexi bacterium]|nr:ferritin family protein [Chloroflexota bacterium]
MTYADLTLEQVIQLGIQREIEARELYLSVLARVDEQVVQDVLRELAAQEEGHRRSLQLLLDEGALERRLAASRRPVEDLHLTDYLEETPLDEHADVQQVLIVAGKREATSHALYSVFAKVAADAEVMNLFEYLAAQELEHKQRIERLYDDLFYREN